MFCLLCRGRRRRRVESSHSFSVQSHGLNPGPGDVIGERCEGVGERRGRGRVEGMTGSQGGHEDVALKVSCSIDQLEEDIRL